MINPEASNNLSFRSLLVIVATLGFYTNIAVYLNKMGFISIAPINFIILLGVISICVIGPPFLINHQLPNYLSVSVVSWIMFYLLICSMWFAPTDMSEPIESIFLKRIKAVLAFCIFLLIFSGSENVQTLVRRTLLLAMCLAMFNNVYEFFSPGSFVSLFSEHANPGRSAGFYVNANLSGSALVLGMIFTVGIFPQKYRWVYLVSVLLAVFLTFSRGSLIQWLLVVIMLLKGNMLRKSYFLMMILGLGFLLYLFLPHLVGFINGQMGIDPTNVIERLNWIQNPFASKGDPFSDRKSVLNLSWEMFMDHPFLGNGMGSAATWANDQLSHNLYLYFMVDHGLIGFFILPFFAISVIWKACGEAKQIALPFLVFVLTEGWVSHNLLEQYHVLIASALMAAMTQRSLFWSQSHS